MSRTTGTTTSYRSNRALARERRNMWRLINEQSSGTMRDELLVMHQMHIAASK